MENNSSFASNVRDELETSSEVGRLPRAKCAFVGGLNEESSTDIDSDNGSPDITELNVYQWVRFSVTNHGFQICWEQARKDEMYKSVGHLECCDLLRGGLRWQYMVPF